MTDTLTTLEAEIIAAGHELERTYHWADIHGTRNGEGWCVRVDGELVAAGGSIGAMEGRLREWWRRSMSADTWITLVSLTLAILVVVDRIRWSSSYRDAMEARLSEKDERILTLEMIISPKIKEHFEATKQMLEGQVEVLQTEVQSLTEQIEQRNEDLRQKVLEEHEREQLEAQRSALIQARRANEARLEALSFELTEVEQALDRGEVHDALPMWIGRLNALKAAHAQTVTTHSNVEREIQDLERRVEELSRGPDGS